MVVYTICTEKLLFILAKEVITLCLRNFFCFSENLFLIFDKAIYWLVVFPVNYYRSKNDI